MGEARQTLLWWSVVLYFPSIQRSFTPCLHACVLVPREKELLMDTRWNVRPGASTSWVLDGHVTDVHVRVSRAGRVSGGLIRRRRRRSLRLVLPLRARHVYFRWGFGCDLGGWGLRDGCGRRERAHLTSSESENATETEYKREMRLTRDQVPARVFVRLAAL